MYCLRATHFRSAELRRWWGSLQEEGGRQMVTHPRVLDNTVRKADDRRKRKRAEKAERQAAEVTAQEQEVKRLKNLKGEEIHQRSEWIFLLASCYTW